MSNTAEETLGLAEARTACLVLVKTAVKLNSEKSEYVLGEVTLGGCSVGNWKITVEQVNGEMEQDPEMEYLLAEELG